MDFLLLDVVDAGVSDSPVNKTLLLVIGATILAEAGVMILARYLNWKQSLLQSLLVNVATLILGYLLIQVAPGLFGKYSLVNLSVLMLITIAAELGLLYLLNKAKPFLFTLLVCVLMNVVSYLLFYLIIRLMER